MKKMLYVLIVFVTLGLGVGTGWYVCDLLNAQDVPPPDGSGIRITMSLDDIEYSAFVNFLTEKIGAEKVENILNTAGKAVLDLLPQETKDQTVVYLLNENREELIRLLEETLAEHGFFAQIDLAAENLEKIS